MSTSILRTTDGWWAVRAEDAHRIATTAATTAELLADRAAVTAADAALRHGGTVEGAAADTVPLVEKIGRLLPPERRWRTFFTSQRRNPRYLQPGDVMTATIADPDGRIDLGTQRTPVVAGE